MSEALLLDYNGVVVDDEPLHCEAFIAVLREEGVVLSRSGYLAEHLGFDDRTCFREALRRAGREVSPDLVGSLVARKGERYLALVRAGLPLVPGAADFVRAAAARWPVAVVSGALRHEIDLGLERAGLAGVAAAVVSAEDVGACKPDPSGLLLALRRLGASRGWRALVIEDSLPGLAAARAVGAGCVMISTSHPPDALRGADAVWPSFEGRTPQEIGMLFREVSLTTRPEMRAAKEIPDPGATR